jgi:arylsulfatase A-like enzyme
MSASESGPTREASVQGPPMAATFPILLAAWLALATGLIEFGIRQLERHAFGRVIGVGLDALWTIPVANLAWFLPVGVGLYVGHRLVRSWVGPPLVIGVLTFVAFTSLVWLLPGVHPYKGGVILALGLAVQTSRTLSRRWFGLRALAYRTLPLLTALVVGAAILLPVVRGFGERGIVAEMPDPDPDAPNVLLVILDTVRSMSMGLYGYARPNTPFLDAYAGEGVVFERAYATASWTLPTHASIFTGRWAHEMSADKRTALDDTFPTVAEALARHGYVSGGFVANTGYGSYEYGLDRGFTHYEDHPRNLGTIARSSRLGRFVTGINRLRRLFNYEGSPGLKRAWMVTDEFLRWLPRVEDRPFFAFLNYFDAHRPYAPPSPYDTMFAGDTVTVRYATEAITEEDFLVSDVRRNSAQQWMDAYDGAIALLDVEMERLIGELEARGLLENTIVIITSDHGEQWGEHNRLFHGNSGFVQEFQIPLLVSYPPAVPSGVRVNTPVSVRDLAATIFDLTGTTPWEPFPGSPLSDFWSEHEDGDTDRATEALEREYEDPLARTADPNGTTTPARLVVGGTVSASGREWIHTLVSPEWYYIQRNDGTEEIYDQILDPGNFDNRIETPEGRGAADEFQAALDTLLGGQPPVSVQVARARAERR